MICGSCKWWKKEENPTYSEEHESFHYNGQCRINPPVITNGDNIWPLTMFNDECSKWEISDLYKEFVDNGTTAGNFMFDEQECRFTTKVGLVENTCLDNCSKCPRKESKNEPS